MSRFNDYTRELAFELSHGFCMCSVECVKKATEIHHKMPNTKVNNNLYPLFLQSIFNACPIARDCHLTKPLPSVTEKEVRVYEKWLEGFLEEVFLEMEPESEKTIETTKDELYKEDP